MEGDEKSKDDQTDHPESGDHIDQDNINHDEVSDHVDQADLDSSRVTDKVQSQSGQGDSLNQKEPEEKVIRKDLPKDTKEKRSHQNQKDIQPDSESSQSDSASAPPVNSSGDGVVACGSDAASVDLQGKNSSEPSSDQNEESNKKDEVHEVNDKDYVDNVNNLNTVNEQIVQNGHSSPDVPLTNGGSEEPVGENSDQIPTNGVSVTTVPLITSNTGQASSNAGTPGPSSNTAAAQNVSTNAAPVNCSASGYYGRGTSPAQPAGGAPIPGPTAGSYNKAPPQIHQYHHRNHSPHRYSPGSGAAGPGPHSRGNSPQDQAPGAAHPGHGQHIVLVHVNPGETFSVRVGDQMQHIQGKMFCLIDWHAILANDMNMVEMLVA